MNNTVLKDGEFKITADQLMQLENGFTLPKLKEWFPEVFVKKLEVGKWYKAFFKDRIEKWGIINVTDFEPGKIIYHGFLFGIYSEKDWCHDQNVFEEATEQEVFEALKNEAVKRGFVEGVYCSHENYTRDQGEEIKGFTYLEKDNSLCGNKRGCGGARIFKNGKWATLIPTKTRKQAEKELNCKIID